MPRPMTTIAIASPRMPRTATFCSRVSILSVVRKPRRKTEKTTNRTAKTAVTISCWLNRKRFILCVPLLRPIGAARLRSHFAELSRRACGPCRQRVADESRHGGDIGLDRGAAVTIFGALDVPILQQRLDQCRGQLDFGDRKAPVCDACRQHVGDEFFGRRLHVDRGPPFRLRKRLRFHEGEREPGQHRLG